MIATRQRRVIDTRKFLEEEKRIGKTRKHEERKEREINKLSMTREMLLSYA